jgi:flagellar motor switch protein FliM
VAATLDADRENNGGTSLAVQKVRSYDFNQPGGLERHHQRSLQLLLEVLSHRVGGALTAGLGIPIHVKLAGLEQLPFEEWAGLLPEPTCLITASFSSLAGRILLHIPVPLAMVLVDLRLGGKGQEVEVERVLTDIESRIISDIVQGVLGEMQPVMAPYLPLRLNGVSQVTGVRFLTGFQTNEVALVGSFSLSLTDGRTYDFTLCLPYTSVRPLVDSIVASELEGGEQEQQGSEEMAAAVLDVPVEVSVQFPSLTLTPREIMGLEPGDVIGLEYEQDRPLFGVVGGQWLFDVLPTTRGKRLACVVVERRRAQH